MERGISFVRLYSAAMQNSCRDRLSYQDVCAGSKQEPSHSSHLQSIPSPPAPCACPVRQREALSPSESGALTWRSPVSAPAKYQRTTPHPLVAGGKPHQG